ncbi:Catechol 1,2-dioxygenase [Fibrisoma limi BUZ 3]|uniref:Catechol 1,2-dioxygenase n=1 Tax=Fibrisoma limi BUZ 3 TaxID=1185876 RepID=I2GCL0_9BACT|nr:dioxygenase [Fibrisoma limi]CCH51634.1 Catechol 1,2-dioxygenase [Fibrisoma limi BUZ 3]
METTRRRFVSLLATLPLTGLFSASFRAKFLTLPATPPCDDHDEPTPSETEGPYFKPNSPERNSLLEQGMGGTRLVLTGRVLTTDCRPVAHALLDWWHADNEGDYDNRGFRLRGHQYTDKNGNFQLETIVPGLYPGRTRHFHVKVQAPNKPVLTTQLYFPDEPGNRRDGLFNPRLLMNVANKGSNVAAGYTFVVTS